MIQPQPIQPSEFDAIKPPLHPDAAYKRIVIKLSGEALGGEGGFGINPEKVEDFAKRIKEVYDLGIEIGIVCGGGNLWRGVVGVERGMEQSTADHMGMIATIMNGLALQDALQRMGMVSRVQTAISINSIAEPYIRLRAIRHLEKGRVVIIAGGTGNPYFTTDTAAALRAMEMGAEVVIKATKVNGVYTADPKKDPNAVRYDHLTYDDVLMQRLEVMDMTAFALCREHDMPILILNLWASGDLVQAVLGHSEVGTLISAAKA
ncbi:MAG: UMP kinase [Armatimonadetes bacterium]|nr:UMP kinase [Anaerolineae bacterium]